MAESRDISISCKNLFLNQCIMNVFKLRLNQTNTYGKCLPKDGLLDVLTVYPASHYLIGIQKVHCLSLSTECSFDLHTIIDNLTIRERREKNNDKKQPVASCAGCHFLQMPSFFPDEGAYLFKQTIREHKFATMTSKTAMMLLLLSITFSHKFA